MTESRGYLLVIAVVLLGVFLPAVIASYGFADDYSILWMAVSGDPSPQFGKDIFAANATGGRPLAGILQSVFFAAAGTIDHLRFVRGAGVLAIVALAMLFHWALVRSAIRPFIAALITLFVCSMPAFQVYASWTVMFVSPYAMLLAAGSSLLAVSTLDAPRQVVPDRLVGTVVMLIAALMIYQPAAMFFWVFFAVALVGAARNSARIVRVARIHFVVAGVAFGITFVATRLMTRMLGAEATAGHRTILTHDVLGKGRWFLEQPLNQALNLFELNPTSNWLALSVSIIAIVGIGVWLLRWSPRPILVAAIAISLVPLAYLPNLVVADTWPPFRTQVALTSLVALYAWLGALGLWTAVRDVLQDRVSQRVLTATERSVIGLSVFVVVLSLTLAAIHVETLIVEPQTTELALLRSQVKEVPTGARRIGFVLADWRGGLTETVAYDEFGLPSSARPWASEPSVDLILREQGRLPRRHPTFLVYPPDASVFPPRLPVVDIRQSMRQLR